MEIQPTDTPTELLLYGVHATSTTREEKIRATKFQPGAEGRVGKGIYFWRDNALAHQLCRAWHTQCLARGDYRGEGKQTLGTLNVEIRVNESSFLDLEEPEFRDALADILVKRRNKGDEPRDDEGYCLLLIEMITVAERQADEIIKVLQSRVAPPAGMEKTYPMNFLGAPLCYVVRDADCITIR